MADTTGCPFGARPHGTTKRHSHDYQPPRHCYQRCGCGHRRFVINVGGVSGPRVECAKCHKPNRTATAYEQGRCDGPRPPIVPASAGPDF